MTLTFVDHMISVLSLSWAVIVGLNLVLGMMIVEMQTTLINRKK